MSVLILGMGYVGSQVAKLLAAEGVTVFGLSRSPRAPTPGVTALTGDLNSPGTLEQLPKSITSVVYALSPDARTDDAYAKAYPTGVKSLLSALPAARVLLVSSTSVYGQEGGERIDDATPAQATDFSSARILEAEALLLAPQRQAPRHAVIRASGIYGPSRTSLLARLRSEELTDAQARTLTNRIHRDDLARALVFLLAQADAGGTFLAVDDKPAALGEMQAWLLCHPLLEHAPVGAPAARTVARRSRQIQATRLKELGFSLSFPSYQEGYSAILAELAQGAAAPSKA